MKKACALAALILTVVFSLTAKDVKPKMPIEDILTSSIESNAKDFPDRRISFVEKGRFVGPKKKYHFATFLENGHVVIYIAGWSVPTVANKTFDSLGTKVYDISATAEMQYKVGEQVYYYKPSVMYTLRFPRNWSLKPRDFSVCHKHGRETDRRTQHSEADYYLQVVQVLIWGGGV